MLVCFVAAVFVAANYAKVTGASNLIIKRQLLRAYEKVFAADRTDGCFQL